MPGGEPISILGLILGVSLVLLILGYALAKWYQEGRFWHRPHLIFNLYHIRNLQSMELKVFPPPFSISGSMHDVGGSNMRFHEGEI